MRDSRLVVRGARLFDGETAHPRPVMVLIEDGRIVDVDLTGAPPPEGVALADLGAVTLMPGLVDAHTHLAFDPNGSTEHQMLHDDDATVMTRMREHAAQALHAGITTLRDLGDRGYLSLRLREEYATGEPGPQIVAAGPPITSNRGHCWYLGGEAEGAEELVAAVTSRAEHGTDLVKIMATGGMSTKGTNPGGSQYGLADLRAVTRTAHGLGLPVTAHAHAAAGITDAVAAGVDGIEHCTFMTRSGVRLDPRTVDAMAAAGTFVGCTVVKPREGMPPEVLETIEPYWENQAYMQRHGVRVVCCTDAGINPHKPHDVLPGDLVYFAAQAATNVEALASVTSLAAESCGFGHRKGRVAPGYDADLLVVDGDPVHHIDDVRRVRAVYRAGQPVARGL
ncbi:amidohydrolase family protein [Streptosporangium sp. NPDC049376]|uniref:amidohydrolase family protein n=1 Tax=Streptosporangium sp. NPDC049376 TaxID=3366192 RepID=UPI0037AEFA07